MLTKAKTTSQAPQSFLESVGTIFAEFGAQTQDSGNVSYGVETEDARFFVKTAGLPDNPQPYLDHPGRVALLRTAIEIAKECVGFPVPSLRNVIESPLGPILVYDWAEGELLGVPREARTDPSSSHCRFCSLPVEEILSMLDAVYALHTHLAAKGWVAVDFYDGCVLYDFPGRKLTIVDLDTYHRGPFMNQMGTMFGSSRFMAPEEFELGATIDEQTTAFTMGRCGLVFLSNGTGEAEQFRASDRVLKVLNKATEMNKCHRWSGMKSFFMAWQEARC